MTSCPEVRKTLLIARYPNEPADSSLFICCVQKERACPVKEYSKTYCFKYTFASRLVPSVRMWTFQRGKAPALETWTRSMWENTRTLQTWPPEGATYVAMFGYKYIYQNQRQAPTLISAVDLYNNSYWFWYKSPSEEKYVMIILTIEMQGTMYAEPLYIFIIHSAEYWVRFIIL